ncbi:hypothetical protein CCL19_16255, partial [Pseudomonas syringae]|uniref:hypothetical protein n=1 Tax=Pseudomonas syringae TaxID=317 RepID=UPI000BCA0049
ERRTIVAMIVPHAQFPTNLLRIVFLAKALSLRLLKRLTFPCHKRPCFPLSLSMKFSFFDW